MSATSEKRGQGTAAGRGGRLLCSFGLLVNPASSEPTTSLLTQGCGLECCKAIESPDCEGVFSFPGFIHQHCVVVGPPCSLVTVPHLRQVQLDNRTESRYMAS
jgi:hypothetical protein